eukprot:scaffold181551_cov39-Prasinocladus_malaysianus.AAC.1
MAWGRGPAGRSDWRCRGPRSPLGGTGRLASGKCKVAQRPQSQRQKRICRHKKQWQIDGQMDG